MEEESQKPFACNVSGCSMSFTNEDHLTVHTKKHDMILNLGTGNKTNVFVADQTPTPTRFIRTCDEVGLFEELLNPFEQTFRRAVESKKTTDNIAIPTVSENTSLVPNINDDMLHTPHIFPNYESTNDKDKETKQKSIDSTTSKQSQTFKLNLKQKKKADGLFLKENEHNSVTTKKKDCLKRINKEVISSKPIKILPKVIQQPPKQQPPQPSHKIVFQIKTENFENGTIAIPIVENIKPKHEIVNQKLKQVLLKSSPIIKHPTIPINSFLVNRDTPPMTNESLMLPSKVKKKVNKTNISNQKRQNEGNRAAAKRYRNRLKIKHEELLDRTKQLELEIHNLRLENHQLKEALSQHTNCVTKGNMTENVNKRVINCPCDTPCSVKCENETTVQTQPILLNRNSVLYLIREIE